MNLTVERFLRYVAVETSSCEESSTRPSTPGQLELTGLLAKEMEALGLQDVHIEPRDGAVFGTIPANTDRQVPTLGFLAHVDTSNAASGRNIHPHIVQSYAGGDLELSPGIVMEEKKCSCLHQVVGEDLIVTDGTTLLGADDKAGVAEIMTMAERLIQSDRPHGTVKLAFTTDEEIGLGPELFDVEAFGCDFAYTVDGGPLGEIESENFNGASARVQFHGVGVHPGAAKDMMKNAAAIATEFHGMLPKEQVPEHTADYEGFIHLRTMQGDVVTAQLEYILRDHDLTKLRQKEQLLRSATDYINTVYGEGTAELTLQETYYNMRQQIEPHRHLLETAEKAFTAVGVRPCSVPIRGGTDGARLSFMGLPCPNLSTGGYQFHGVFEFIPVRALETMPEVLTNIVYEYGKGENTYV